MFGASLFQYAVYPIKFFFSRLMLLLFHQSYLLQYPLLFNFADWQCVVQIISKCGLVTD